MPQEHGPKEQQKEAAKFPSTALFCEILKCLN
jgi:hypothetical protein